MKSHRASNTAKVIAGSTILLAQDVRTKALVAPGAAEICQHLLSSNLLDRCLALSARLAPSRACWRLLERLTLPGIMRHYWLRKNWLEARCRAAITGGSTRLLVMGAGFDTLGLRLAREMPDLEVMEIDHPATQAVKIAALKSMSDALPGNLQFVARDLGGQGLPLQLFEHDKPSIVVLEGLLMYLSVSEVDTLFKWLKHGSSQPTRVMFSFMTEWSDGSCGFRPRSWLIEQWLRWRKEPFTWALPPAALAAFLHTRGFALNEWASADQLGESGTLRGENLVDCVRIQSEIPA